mmetsp:Transcript_529/g.688  ORF Transcript_529/g.688 Transcript_529/m.688 type:complete len:349 (-) Transcript_529:243-1289(-)
MTKRCKDNVAVLLLFSPATLLPLRRRRTRDDPLFAPRVRPIANVVVVPEGRSYGGRELGGDEDGRWKRLVVDEEVLLCIAQEGHLLLLFLVEVEVVVCVTFLVVLAVVLLILLLAIGRADGLGSAGDGLEVLLGKLLGQRGLGDVQVSKAPKAAAVVPLLVVHPRGLKADAERLLLPPPLSTPPPLRRPPVCCWPLPPVTDRRRLLRSSVSSALATEGFCSSAAAALLGLLCRGNEEAGDLPLFSSPPLLVAAAEPGVVVAIFFLSNLYLSRPPDAAHCASFSRGSISVVVLLTIVSMSRSSSSSKTTTEWGEEEDKDGGRGTVFWWCRAANRDSISRRGSCDLVVRS